MARQPRKTSKEEKGADTDSGSSQNIQDASPLGPHSWRTLADSVENLVNSLSLFSLDANAWLAFANEICFQTAKLSDTEFKRESVDENQSCTSAESSIIHRVSDTVFTAAPESSQTMAITKDQSVSDTNSPTLSAVDGTKEVAEETTSSLLDFPGEILVIILEFTLSGKTAVPVNLRFESRVFDRPLVDYRVLHTCRRLYKDGINAYFRQNTWAIDLGLFREEPDGFCGPLDDMDVDSWPYGTGQQIQAAEVHRVVVTNDRHHYFQDAPRLLRVFEMLDYVGFDMNPGSYRTWDQLHKVDAGEEVVKMLERSGVKLSKGAKVEVGDVTLDEAWRKLGETLEPHLAEGVEAWEQGRRRPFWAHPHGRVGKQAYN